MNSAAEPQSIVELMPGFTKQNMEGSVRYVFHWYRAAGTTLNKGSEVLIFFAGVTAVFLTFNSVWNLFTGKAGFFQAAMSVLFFLLGLAFTYRGLALAMNRSIFISNDDSFLVYHRPLPYPGASSLELPTREIAGIEWRKVGHSSRTGDSAGSIHSGYSATYDVVLQATSDRSFSLIPGIRSREYAFALASELSKAVKP